MAAPIILISNKLILVGYSYGTPSMPTPNVMQEKINIRLYYKLSGVKP
jgi:hypothetical protein